MVFNPTLAEDGYVSDHTVIQIVHADMPFLVDSVTMAVNRGGRTAHWIVHPLMAVQRDDKGLAMRIGRVPADRNKHQQAGIESLIMVECDRIIARTRNELAAELKRVLGDVRHSVQDWKPMLARLDEVCIAAQSAPLTADSKREGIAFLRWLEDLHFTFLGVRDYDLQRDGNNATLLAREESGLGILRGQVQTQETHLPAEAVQLIDTDELVLVIKAMTRSTVHRPAWLDYIAVKRFDAAGQVCGETRFLGLYTSTAYAALVADIPQVRQRVRQVLAECRCRVRQPRGQVTAVHSRELSARRTVPDRHCDTERACDRHPAAAGAPAYPAVPAARSLRTVYLGPGIRATRPLQHRAAGQGGQRTDGRARWRSLEFTPMLTDSPRIHYLVRARSRAHPPASM